MQYLRTHPRVKLGCSKCRYSKGGCGKCRADAVAARAGVSPAAAAATSPAAGRQSARRRQQLQQGVGPAPASKTPVAGPTSAGQQFHRRRERQQREEDEEVPSQDLAGNKAPPLISPAVAARRKSGAGATGGRHRMRCVCVRFWLGACTKHCTLCRSNAPCLDPGPPRTGRCFDGCLFLVTGFGDASEEKRAVLRALREGGATVADAVPDPPAAQASPGRLLAGDKRLWAMLCSRCLLSSVAGLPAYVKLPPMHCLQTAAGRRQSAGARQLALQPAITAVVTDRRIRTPK